MSNQTIISVENVGKTYRINHEVTRERYVALRDVVADKLKRLFRTGRANHDESGSREDFWALRNVDFKVEQGEVLGIIGRNGAGKSTLLKILSRITEPSEGCVRLKGRVASLLEVGTGFHPELTGRENISLNGAILGMSKAEIRRNFDEIVAFAEVEKFLDTPVKRYSSGMYVRLAFAVAAHMQPEILIIDEVLAVGDSAFQKKCLGKMDSVAGDGRTVLFVSHNMAVIQRLCKKTAVLSGGRLSFYGDTNEAVQLYLSASNTSGSTVFITEKQHLPQYNGATLVRLKKVELANARNSQFAVRWREQIDLKLSFEVSAKMKNVVFGVSVSNSEGVVILGAHSTDLSGVAESLDQGEYTLDLSIENPLMAGDYTVTIGAHSAVSRDILFLVLDAVTLEVLDVSVDDRAYDHKNRVLINTNVMWRLSQSENSLIRA